MEKIPTHPRFLKKCFLSLVHGDNFYNIYEQFLPLNVVSVMELFMTLCLYVQIALWNTLYLWVLYRITWWPLATHFQMLPFLPYPFFFLVPTPSAHVNGRASSLLTLRCIATVFMSLVAVKCSFWSRFNFFNEIKIHIIVFLFLKDYIFQSHEIIIFVLIP